MTEETKKRILLVDNEKNFTILVKLNLEETGDYEIRTENDARKAIDAAREFKPDIIFLDVLMPHIDGGQIGHKLAADEDLKDVPVIFLTAAVTEGEVSSRGGIIGEHNFLAKPVTTDRLIECIKNNIG